MNDRPLISIAILSYKNYKYIKEALASVLIQDYPNIQLIISNDGSDDFNETDLISYIEKNKKANIKSLYINNNAHNMGTVKNVNFARSKADGEFFMLLAADDALYDEHVLSRFIEEFERLGPKSFIVSARTAMCAHELSDVVELFPDNEGVEAIKNFSPQEMFSRLSHTFTIPTTSTCYRMSLYDIIGDYDESYFIIEDAPLYIRMARLGYKFHWIDDMIAARHRDGGISHGNKINLSEAYRKYRYDEIILYQMEILPYKDLILPNDIDKMMHKWEYLDRAYFQTFILPNMSKAEKRKYMLKNWKPLLRSILKRTKDKTIEISFDDNFCKEIAILSSILIIAFALINFVFNEYIIESSTVDVILNLLTLLLILFSSVLFLFYTCRFVYRVYLAVKFIIKGR